MADDKPNAEVAGWIDGPAINPHDPDATDPKLLRENSEIKQYKTSRFTYDGVRVFYRRHAQADELPSPPLPLIVFVHGLGGSVAQFYPLLTSLTHLSSCLAIDLPGCGRSKFDPTSWDAYSYEALVELLDVIIDEYRQRDPGRTVILIGHSLGTNLCARLASKTEPGRTKTSHHAVGYVGICPVAGPSAEAKTNTIRRLLYIPDWLFNLWRAWDQWGGPYSASVTRFAGSGGDIHFRNLQNRYNKQSRTPVFRRVAWGTMPIYDNGEPKGGMRGKDVWAGLDVPAFFIGGESDDITPPGEIHKIEEFLSERSKSPLSSPEIGSEADSDAMPVASAAPVNPSTRPSEHIPANIEDIREEDFVASETITNQAPLNREDSAADEPSTPAESLTGVPTQPRHPDRIVKSIVLPSPANHALMYQTTTVRIVAGLISDFLQSHVTNRLSLGWQLQYLSREGKWDVKNLEKWRRVAPVSAPIGPAGGLPVFRAMKTLREADDVHSPAEFVKRQGHVIKDVVDISHDRPVYDPRTMELAGITYHKFATVSKIPPTDKEVESFVRVVDRIREQRRSRAGAASEDGEERVENIVDPEQMPVIGVHCHYGFNRTGYFLVCYLVERCGLGVQEAIDTFAAARPNGIRHSHFLDRLFVRYSGLMGKDGDAGVENE